MGAHIKQFRPLLNVAPEPADFLRGLARTIAGEELRHPAWDYPGGGITSTHPRLTDPTVMATGDPNYLTMDSHHNQPGFSDRKAILPTTRAICATTLLPGSCNIYQMQYAATINLDLLFQQPDDTKSESSERKR